MCGEACNCDQGDFGVGEKSCDLNRDQEADGYCAAILVLRGGPRGSCYNSIHLWFTIHRVDTM